jgi:tetratricopeptide (TPR) repeat protein
MPESACLHIQARDADLIRVVEIPGTSVRIGRASYCEVRLSEPEVADEECLLRRRGGTWHLVPVGRSRRVMLGEQPVERPMPIPFGVSFQVGDHRLTLQATGEGPGRWGSFQRPIPLEVPSVEATPLDEPEPTRRAPGSEPEPGPAGFEDEQERLARWQARHEQRESWLRTRQEERRWEERWKAAGERLRARSASAASVSAPRPAPSPDFTPRHGVDRIASPTRDDLRARKIIRRSVPITPLSTTGAAPPIAPEPVIPPRPHHQPVTSSDWGALPIPPRGDLPSAPVNPSRDPSTSIEPATVEVALPPSQLLSAIPTVSPDQETGSELFSANVDSWPSEEGQGEESAKDAWAGSIVPAPFTPHPDLPPQGEKEKEDLPQLERPSLVAQTEEPFLPPSSFVGEGWGRGSVGDPLAESLASAPTPPHSDPPLEEVTEESGIVEPIPSALPPVNVAPEPVPERFEMSTGSFPNGWDDQTAFIVDTNRAAPASSAIADRVEEVGPTRARPPVGAGRAKQGSARTTRKAAPDAPPIPIPEPARQASDDPAAASRDWPTAREIFAAHRARQEAQAAARPTPAPTRAQPLPTVSREPSSWSLPLWLAWPPALAGCLSVGGLVLTLALTWSQDEQTAGMVANHLARPKEKRKPLPETVIPPEHPSWWKTTSGNLDRWAMERAQGPREPGLAEEVHALLDAAVAIAPADPVARLALARTGPGDENAAPIDRSLGLSRDVVALAWSGRQLLASGKKEAALKAYREALAMASRAELSRLAPPGFLDDPQTRRYALPYEELLGAVIRDLVERADWPFAEWSAALPRIGVAPLVAARLLRERGSLDADAALDTVLADNTESPLPEDLSAAVYLAAQGEALALRSRWSEAEQRYQQAIDLMPDDRVRRSWSFNLADLALRLGDEPKRLKALEAARGIDSRDEIAQRAQETLREAILHSLTSGSRTADASRANGLR